MAFFMRAHKAQETLMRTFHESAGGGARIIRPAEAAEMSPEAS